MMKMTFLKPATAAAAAVATVLGIVAVTAMTGCSNDSGTSQDEGTAVSRSSDNSVAGTGAAAAPAAGGGSSSDHAAMGHGSSSAAGTGEGASSSSGGDHAMGTSGIEALKALKSRDFDIAFLSQMIAHHEAAVEMAKQALKTATKPETKQEAQKVIDAQVKEIAQMTGWLKEWYSAEPSKEQQALVKADMQSMMAMPITKDNVFFEMMVPHHQGAIEMSELVPDRSERAEVKQLAQQIIKDQKAEIERYHQLMGHGG